MWFCNTAAGFFVAIYMYEMLVRIHYPLSMFQRLVPGHLRYPLAFIHEQEGLFFTEVSVAGGIIYSDKADLFGFCLESKEPASLFFSFCSICMNREQKGKVGGGGESQDYYLCSHSLSN